MCALAVAEADERVLVAEAEPEEALLVAEAELVADADPLEVAPPRGAVEEPSICCWTVELKVPLMPVRLLTDVIERGYDIRERTKTYVNLAEKPRAGN